MKQYLQIASLLVSGFFFLLGLVSFSAYAEQTDWWTRIINIPYYEAREIILDNGWKPVQAERDDLDAKYGTPHFYYDAGYPEVTACSGTGMGYCAFKFYNEKGYYLNITTKEGDYRPDDKYPPVVIYVGFSKDPD